AAARRPAVSSALGVPAPVALDDLAVLLEAGQDPVEVVLLDTHLRRDLGDRDARLGLDELEGLKRPRAGAARAPAPAGAGRLARPCCGTGGGAPAPRGARRGACRRRTGKPGERRRRRLELAVLVDQWLELAHSG